MSTHTYPPEGQLLDEDTLVAKLLEWLIVAVVVERHTDVCVVPILSCCHILDHTDMEGHQDTVDRQQDGLRLRIDSDYKVTCGRVVH